MATLATLTVKIVGDASEMVKAVDAAEKKADSLGTKMGTLGGSFMKAGGLMTAGLTLPIVAGFNSAANAASDYEESLSKAMTVFGDAGPQVKAFADSAAESVGLSNQKALELTGTMGNLLMNMEMGEQVSADWSIQMAQNAADLASFNNASPEDTFAAIQAGLIGSSEPLRKYGIILTEAKVQSKALELGLADANGEISEQAKVTARLTLIQEGMGASLGDFTRTAEGAANATRINTARLEDLKTKIGSDVLPIKIKLIEIVGKVLTWFNKLSDGQRKNIIVILAVVATIGPLLVILGTLFSAVGTIISIVGSLSAVFGAIMPVITAVAAVISFPLIAIIAAVIAIIALLVLAWKNNWGDIQGKTEAVVNFLKTLISGWVDGVKKSFETIIDIIKWWYGGVKDNFDLVSGVMKSLGGFIDEWVGGIKSNFNDAKDFVNDLKNAFSNSMGAIVSAIQRVIDKVMNFINAIKKIVIPNVLQQRSPSEFEKSLLSIVDAFDELNKRSVPDFRTNLTRMNGRGRNISREIGQPSDAGFGTIKAGNTYQIYTTTKYEPEETTSDFIRRLRLAG